MLALLLTPAVLSSLVLAAHFLRRGAMLPFALCLAMAALPAVRRPWVPRVLQGLLGLAVLVWARTLSRLVRDRAAAHEEWTRMAIILGAVALVAAVAALLLAHGRVTAHYRREAAPRA